jgi:hypothetical protein
LTIEFPPSKSVCSSLLAIFPCRVVGIPFLFLIQVLWHMCMAIPFLLFGLSFCPMKGLFYE